MKMNGHSIKTGFSFGLTSGIITTLGLMVGLASGTQSRLAVIGGIITIAIADALSDALGIHIAEESEAIHTKREIWESTVATFLAKLVFALTFIIPVLLFSLINAIIISIVWGILLLSVFSFYIAKWQEVKPQSIIIEHLIAMVIVVALAHYAGIMINLVFN